MLQELVRRTRAISISQSVNVNTKTEFIPEAYSDTFSSKGYSWISELAQRKARHHAFMSGVGLGMPFKSLRDF